MTWTPSRTDFGYTGYNGDKGAQFGSKSNPAGEFALTAGQSLDKVQKVVANIATSAAGETTLTVKVGDTTIGESVTIPKSSANADYTFDAATATDGVVSLNFNSVVVYIKTITIYYGGGTVVEVPVFDLAEGEYFGSRTLTITAGEGATVDYTVTLDSKEVKKETAAASPVTVTLDQVGTYTVTAKAVKGSDASSEITKTYTIKAAPVIAFQAMDPANVKEGKYIIAYTSGDKSYVMKNEVYQNYYVTGTEFDLTTGEIPTEEYLFEVKAVEGGYNIVNNAGTYVSMVASGSHINLKPSEADAAVWTIEPANVEADGAYAVKATVPAVTAENASYLQFQLYKGTTPEFCAGANYLYPTFYAVSTSGVAATTAEAAKVYGTSGAIRVNAPAATTVRVYNAAGQAAATVKAEAGETTVNVPAGFYIVKAGTTVAKVIVK